MIRARLVRTLTALAVIAGALVLAGCYGEDGYQLPTRAMKELSPQTLALLEQKHMPKDSPILIRLFKEESELEVWKQDTTGRFQLLKVYPICRWSGDLGPKVHEGDRQAPEGFYTITPNLMNPDSNYYLAINTGFPNAYDKANNRHGAFLMIHGDCSSRGCYAMTDEQIGEIYSLARDALLGGQQSFQIQAYPFRLTPANLARHRTNPNMAFWRMIKVGNDHFEVSHLEPKVEVCNRRYVFDPVPPPNSKKPLVFNPTGRCPAFVVAPEIVGPALAKQHSDDLQFAQLVRANVWVAPVRTGLDGGMNRVFLAQVGGGIPPARVVPPDATGTVAAADVPPQPQPTVASRWLGGLFGSSAGSGSTQVAATDSASQERGGGGGGFFSNLFSSHGNTAQQPNPAGTLRGTEPEPITTAASQPAKPATHHEIAAAGLRPKPKTEANKTEANKTEANKSEANKLASHKGEPYEAAKAKPTQPQQDANAATPPAANVLTGAQPVVPAGSFDSRWAAIH